MDLRPELLPPTVGPARLAEISREIEQIETLIHQGNRAEADRAIAAFNARTGHDYAIDDFAEYYGWRDLEDFAREAARPAWPRIADISRAELIEIVHRIQATDPDSDYYLLLLQTNTPHPRASDLIFHPPTALQNASADAIVDAALSYRAIAL